MNSKYSLAQLAAIYTAYKDLDPKIRTVNCCTCGKSLYIGSVEDSFIYWGHYVPRSIAPKLKFHPLNTHCQCVKCNMQVSKDIDEAYDKYMIYRYGENIKETLLHDEDFDEEDYAKNWYFVHIVELSQKFPELEQVVVDTSTGEVLSVVEIEDKIQEQFETYSRTFKQDLDELTRLLGTEPIEYERF